VSVLSTSRSSVPWRRSVCSLMMAPRAHTSTFDNIIGCVLSDVKGRVAETSGRPRAGVGAGWLPSGRHATTVRRHQTSDIRPRRCALNGTAQRATPQSGVTV
jgi:hypothetical protein